ncbi:ISL3 family transposase [Agromyces archimandritae]|uniref:ISL3 family transposase n=1 Tax=Agromyces archimandritae TaxID=2781962 RepID=A0A975FPH1_9MICO|nr:ISL3 family transposase [Agromyces archimandritae]QTX06105.1 ISL3 family transposase [Agromyces archimandritae]QTX06198.1 ISL3 family transposase [Agromyces archimandritae]QTX06213.1 ISL3 family transposase [Agromyces archimandritae]
MLVGLDGLRVTGVEHRSDGVLVIDVESPPGPVGCPGCGVVAESAGRKALVLKDAPMGTRPVRVRWRKRRWRCRQDGCEVRAFTEQNPAVAAPNAILTARAVAWAVTQMRRENASVRGVARQLRVAWGTVWTHVEAELQRREKDPGRFDGVEVLGVDEHLWHHVSTKPVAEGGRGPKELTGMVDLTRDASGHVRARLLDLVPGRSSKAYADWIKERTPEFRTGVKIAALDPFAGYKKALDDELDDATAVLDAFHVVKLGTAAVDEVRRRVQQDTLGHRGRKGDPLYGIRNILRAGRDRLTDKQRSRLETAFARQEEHIEVEVAWHAAQQLRDAYKHPDLTEGRKIALAVLGSFPSCPIPEIARLGKTLNQWRDAFLAYWATNRSSNGGTEAVNGLIELARRVARGFRNYDNYRLRMLLIAGGLDTPAPT